MSVYSLSFYPKNIDKRIKKHLDKFDLESVLKKLKEAIGSDEEGFKYLRTDACQALSDYYRFDQDFGGVYDGIVALAKINSKEEKTANDTKYEEDLLLKRCEKEGGDIEEARRTYEQEKKELLASRAISVLAFFKIYGGEIKKLATLYDKFIPLLEKALEDVPEMDNFDETYAKLFLTKKNVG